MIHTDVDIDVLDRDQILSKIKHVSATMVVNGETRNHASGVYMQNIPMDPFTGRSTIEYKEAEELGYFKIDLLNNSIYDGVKDEQHLDRLLGIEPNWELLEYEEFVSNLSQVSNYPDLLRKLKPKSIDQLAMVLAIIRPSKVHLQTKSWDEIEKEVWVKPTDGQYYYKKSHSVAFAASIVVQMNLIVEQSVPGN